MMALELFMVGLVTRDLEKSLEFYQRLGLAIPARKEEQTNVEVKMQSSITLFFMNAPGGIDVPDSSRTVFEFFLPSRATVDEKYIELTDGGYQSLRAPAFEGSMNVYFALIMDPDGHSVMISAA